MFNFLRKKSASPSADLLDLASESRVTQPLMDIEKSDPSYDDSAPDFSIDAKLRPSDPSSLFDTEPESSDTLAKTLHTNGNFSSINHDPPLSTEDSLSEISEVDQQNYGEQTNMEASFTKEDAGSSISIDVSEQPPSLAASNTTKRIDSSHSHLRRPSGTGQTRSAALNASLSIVRTSVNPFLAAEAPEIDHNRIKVNSILAQSAPPNKLSIMKTRRISRQSSAPPEYHSPPRNKATGKRLDDATEPITPVTMTANMPAHAQMLSHLQSWTLYLRQVEDRDLRKQILTVISQKFETVWMNAMRMGLIPFNWQDEMRTQARAGKTSLDVDVIGSEENQITEQEIIQHEWYPRGRVGEMDKGKKKRSGSPSREILVDTRLHRGSRQYAITAGELLEAGVNMKAVQKQVETKDLGDGDDLLAEVLDQLDQADLFEYNWKGVAPRTTYNILGRNLKLYCIWEMQRSETLLETYKRLLSTFAHATQIKNTQNRIDTEQSLHDQLLVIALELDAQDKVEISSDESGTEADSEVQEISSNSVTFPVPDASAVKERPLIAVQNDALVPEETQRDEQTTAQDVDTEFQIPIPTQEDSAQVSQQALTTDSNPDGEHLIQQKCRSEPAVQVECGVKRAADEAEARLNPTKKRRCDGHEDNELCPDSKILSKSAVPIELMKMTPTAWPRGSAYVQFILIPKANQHLLKAGHPILPETTSFVEIRKALAGAKLSPVADSLWKELNENLGNWDIQFRACENGVLEIDGIEGYPTRKEIFNAIPPEGMTGAGLRKTFAGRVSATDPKWQTLVQSVARYDHPLALWHRREELNDKLRHRLVVNLKVSQWKGFKPEDYSSRTVNNTSGFRWRYLPTATIAQREAMDEVVPLYAKHTKDCVAQAKAAGYKKQHRYDFHGKYAVLTNPYQAGLDPTAPVVHGVWDLEGRKSQDNRVPGMEWFYEGRDGDVVETWVMRYEKDDDGKPVRMLEREIEGMSTEDQVKGKHVRVDSISSAKARPRVKLTLGATGLDGAVGVSKGKRGRKGVMKAFGPKGSDGKMGKGKREEQTVAAGRARRGATAVLRYTEVGTDDSDGDYRP